MTPFRYHRPDSLDQALSLLANDEDIRPIAGGMTLIPTLKQGLASMAELVDLAAIRDLYGIVQGEDWLEIRAMTRHHDVATAPLILSMLPGLAALASGIGDPQVRNRGTIGGSIANNDPAADYPAALLALRATIVTSRRSLAASAFFTGMFETALDPGEIVTAVRFPAPRRCGYAKLRNPVSGYPMAGVFVAEHPDGVSVGVTGAGSVVFAPEALEAALSQDLSVGAARSVEHSPQGLLSDLHGSSAYRAQLVRVMAGRAVSALLATPG